MTTQMFNSIQIVSFLSILSLKLDFLDNNLLLCNKVIKFEKDWNKVFPDSSMLFTIVGIKGSFFCTVSIDIGIKLNFKVPSFEKCILCAVQKQGSDNHSCWLTFLNTLNEFVFTAHCPFADRVHANLWLLSGQLVDAFLVINHKSNNHSTNPMVYANSEEACKPRLEPVTNGYQRAPCQQILRTEEAQPVSGRRKTCHF